MDSWDELELVEAVAAVEPLVWGRSTYRVIRLPGELVDAAAAAHTRRVSGWVDQVEVNLGVNRADVLPDAFAYCGDALLRRLGVRVGDAVQLRLRPADPDAVLVADDVRAALGDAGAWDAFTARRPAEQRRLLQPVEDAAREETRQRRVQALVRALVQPTPSGTQERSREMS